MLVVPCVQLCSRLQRIYSSHHLLYWRNHGLPLQNCYSRKTSSLGVSIWNHRIIAVGTRQFADRSLTVSTKLVWAISGVCACSGFKFSVWKLPTRIRNLSPYSVLPDKCRYKTVQVLVINGSIQPAQHLQKSNWDETSTSPTASNWLPQCTLILIIGRFDTCFTRWQYDTCKFAISNALPCSNKLAQNDLLSSIFAHFRRFSIFMKRHYSFQRASNLHAEMSWSTAC